MIQQPLIVISRLDNFGIFAKRFSQSIIRRPFRTSVNAERTDKHVTLLWVLAWFDGWFARLLQCECDDFQLIMQNERSTRGGWQLDAWGSFTPGCLQQVFWCGVRSSNTIPQRVNWYGLRTLLKFSTELCFSLSMPVKYLLRNYVFLIAWRTNVVKVRMNCFWFNTSLLLLMQFAYHSVGKNGMIMWLLRVIFFFNFFARNYSCWWRQHIPAPTRNILTLSLIIRSLILYSR